MGRLVEWFARNGVAANLVAGLILVSGLMAIPQIKREVFPEFDSDWVMVEMRYPGAAPEETEEQICARVEQAVEGLVGVKQVVSSAAENAGVVSMELLPGTDAGDFLDQVKSRVDAVDTFPKDANKPVSTEIIIRKQVINVAVFGPANELALKRAAERVRDELLALPEISQVQLANVRPYEITVNLREEDLRQYDLSFEEVAQAIRASSLNLPGGIVRTRKGEVLIRSNTQAYSVHDFEQLVLRTTSHGARLTLGDVAKVRDAFEEVESSSEFNGQPAALVRVFRVGDQSALEIAEVVKRYVTTTQHTMPVGVSLETWQDDASYLRGRLNLLYRNGQAGLILVFAILALFLRFRLAIWVTFGIPISFLGTIWLMPTMDVSISLISLFAFIVVLGIVVDDAIVMGENIYTHQQRYGAGIASTVNGAKEVARPVVFGVLTTVAAFYPLLQVEGNTGKILRFIPLIVIPTLLFSLIECLVILPAHLRGLPNAKKKHDRRWGWSRFQKGFADAAESFAQRIYKPTLEFCLNWRYLTVCSGVAILLLTLAGYAGGHFRFTFFPPVEGDNVAAWVTYPRGAPVETTEAAVARLARASEQLQSEFGSNNDDRRVILHALASVGQQPFRTEAERAGGNYAANHAGSHKGEVHLEVSPSEERTISSQQIADRWRELAGDFPGAEEVGFSANIFSAGKPVNIRLTGPDMNALQAAASQLKKQLADIDGVRDISDSFRLGKREFLIRLTSEGETLGIRQAALAAQVRQAFYGEEAQRLQRNRDDVKVMVRYPLDQRQSVRDLQEMRIRVRDGDTLREVPLSTVATIKEGRGYSEIRRVDGRRAVNITADVDIAKVESNKIIARLEAEELPELLAAFPGVQYSLEGDQAEQSQTMESMLRAYLVAMVIIYGLLAIPFRSYLQPFIVMGAIPFGLIGAVLGHLMMGMDLTILSLFGVVALTGVVVNDSLVMVDFVNRNRPQYPSLLEAVRASGVQRFRAIMLTSLTTFAGLAPLVFFEKSVQAQFLVPMAISLSFGVMFATVVTLVLVPAGYMILEDIKATWGWLYGSGPEGNRKTDQAIQVNHL